MSLYFRRTEILAYYFQSTGFFLQCFHAWFQWDLSFIWLYHIMICICQSISSGQWSLLEIVLIYNQRSDMCGRSAGFSTAWFYTPQEHFDKRWITALQSNHTLDFDIRLHACTGISLLIKSTTRACDALRFWTCVCGEEDGGRCESLDALHWTSKAKHRQLLLNYCCWKTHKHTERGNTPVSVGICIFKLHHYNMLMTDFIWSI